MSSKLEVEPPLKGEPTAAGVQRVPRSEVTTGVEHNQPDGPAVARPELAGVVGDKGQLSNGPQHALLGPLGHPDPDTLCDRRDFAAAAARGYAVAMTNRWYAYFSLALEGPASS